MIGEICDGIDGSDIALVRLEDGLTFSHEPFFPVRFEPPAITGLKGFARVRYYDHLYFDSPFSGFAEAQVLGKTFEKIPGDEDGAPNHWIHALVTKTSVSEECVKEGTCGSVVWDDDGEAVAFFQYAEGVEKAHMVSVEGLIRAGFQVEAI